MILYDIDQFREWLARQPGGQALMASLTRIQLCTLHNLMDAFRMELEHETQHLESQIAARHARLLPDAAWQRQADAAAQDAARAKAQWAAMKEVVR